MIKHNDDCPARFFRRRCTCGASEAAAERARQAAESEGQAAAERDAWFRRAVQGGLGGKRGLFADVALKAAQELDRKLARELRAKERAKELVDAAMKKAGLL